MSETRTPLHTAVEDRTSTAIWARPDQELLDTLTDCHQAVQQLTAHCALLIRELEGRGVPAAQHAYSTPVWLRDLLHISVPAGKRLVELGHTLNTRQTRAVTPPATRRRHARRTAGTPRQAGLWDCLPLLAVQGGC